MKIYNPFKPHLVQFNDGSYAYRKFALIAWVLLDREGDHWWFGKVHWQIYCYGSKTAAETALEKWQGRLAQSKYDSGKSV